MLICTLELQGTSGTVAFLVLRIFSLPLNDLVCIWMITFKFEWSCGKWSRMSETLENECEESSKIEIPVWYFFLSHSFWILAWSWFSHSMKYCSTLISIMKIYAKSTETYKINSKILSAAQDMSLCHPWADKDIISCQFAPHWCLPQKDRFPEITGDTVL